MHISDFHGALLNLLAEDIGFHIGDGSMGTYVKNDGQRHSFTYSGHAKDDRDYFENILIPRKNKLFSINKYNYQLRRNEIRFAYNSKDQLVFFKELGIPTNSKDDIDIPPFVSHGQLSTKAAFIRGLFDADGCLTFKKKYKTRGYYPVISFSTKSSGLIKSVRKLVEEFDISCTTYERGYFDKRTKRKYLGYGLDINGINKLEKWISKIGFSNKKYSEKYLAWKANGFYDGSEEN